MLFSSWDRKKSRQNSNNNRLTKQFSSSNSLEVHFKRIQFLSNFFHSEGKSQPNDRFSLNIMLTLVGNQSRYSISRRKFLECNQSSYFTEAYLLTNNTRNFKVVCHGILYTDTHVSRLQEHSKNLQHTQTKVNNLWRRRCPYLKNPVNIYTLHI